jgi:hypothetical protein
MFEIVLFQSVTSVQNTLKLLVSIFYKCKGKGRPRIGHEGHEWEQKCNSTLSLTSALLGGGWLK